MSALLLLLILALILGGAGVVSGLKFLIYIALAIIIINIVVYNRR